DAADKIMPTIGEGFGWQCGALWEVEPHSQSTLSQSSLHQANPDQSTLGEGGAVSLAADERALLRCVATWQRPHPDAAIRAGLDAFEAGTREMTVTLGKGTIGQVWQTGRVVWLEDSRTDPSFLRAGSARLAGLRGAWMFPIRIGEHVLGVIEFLSQEPAWPDEYLREMAATIGSQIGYFIERRHAEAAVRASEARKSAMVGAALDAIVSMDSNGLVTEWNPAAERIFGYMRQDVLGRDIGELIVPERFREAHYLGRDCYLRSGESRILNQRLELAAVRADGREILVELVVAAIHTEGEMVFTGFLRDITASKRDENRLRMLESAVVNANDAILITEAEPIDFPGPRIIYVNDAFIHMTGYTLEEVIGKTPRILQGTKTDPAQRAKIRQALKNWQPIVVELVNYHKDGSEFWVELSIVPVADEKGWFTHWVSTQRDISGRKRDEEVLQRAQQEAEQAREEAEQAREEAERANRAKSEFLSRMSHELRTPLNAILGFGQLLEMDPLDAAQKESVGQIMKGGRHLLDLINEVLDIARIESGNLAMSPEPTSLDEVLHEIAGLVRPLAEARRITVDIPVHSGCYALADRQRLKQVLLNLFSNAVKYNRVGGAVSVTCEHAADERIVITVRDTGHGIAAEDLRRLFAPFERLGADAGNVEGTGLGLALSRRLTEAMNGTLEVQSTLGDGTAFIVNLPQANSQLPQFSASSSSGTVTASFKHEASHTVLYIEDNPSNLRLLERILIYRPSVRLIGSETGRSGLEDARVHQPHVILLDLHLPDMSGQDVLRALREEPATHAIPVVIVSADGTAGQAQRLLDAGAQGYLTKPFDVSELLQTIDELF
ncbi:MAG: hypothetical protein JWN98_1965, partial [Abditibacteriota bacterium]|nr:hypothetical protein [Abditibacteriota bacterium]